MKTFVLNAAMYLLQVQIHFYARTFSTNVLHAHSALSFLGVDDKASECDLDGRTEWHWKVVNNGDKEQLEKSVELMIEDLHSVLSQNDICT